MFPKSFHIFDLFRTLTGAVFDVASLFCVTLNLPSDCLAIDDFLEYRVSDNVCL